MTVMVTGGAGMIGARIVGNLLARGLSVVSFDTESTQPRLDRFSDDGRLIRVGGDIRNETDVRAAVDPHGVEHIIHMAALLAPITEDEPALGMTVNISGTNNIFEVARHAGVKRVVYPTSMAVYADQDFYGDTAVNEDSERHPFNLYGYSKLINEEVAKAYTRNFGLDTRGLRIATVLGHGRVTGRSAAAARIISCAAVGEPAVSNVAAEQVTPFIFVDDVAETLVRVCFAENLDLPVYVGSNIPASMGEIVDIIRRYAPDCDIRFEKGAVPYPVIKRMDASRIEEAIDYRMPSLETRILDQMNEARRERQMPEIKP